MKTNEATIFVFIASIIIGILISSSMNFQKINNQMFLSPAEYQEAYDRNSKLNKEIDDLTEKYYQYYTKLESYKDSRSSENNVLEEMKKEINNNEALLGNIDVAGEGIIIKLEDGYYEESDLNELATRTVHDYDLQNVINELRLAGAEAVSLNGQRITYKSSILCWGVFVEVDGVKIPGPFNIQVIGNKEKMYSYMTAEGGYLSFLKIRGIRVSAYKYDDIKIMASDEEAGYKYIREVEAKKK